MKKLIGLFLIMCLVLVGCGNKEPEKQEQDNKVEDSNVEQQDSSKEEVSDKTEETVKGYAFEFNGVTIPMNVQAAPVIEALGEPNQYFESASCAFQGLDKFYTYSGFEVSTYPNGDEDYIYTVYFLDDSVETEKGIYLGATLDEVIQAYGDNYTEKDGAYTYTLDGTTLTFLIEDGTVAAITYSALVEGLNA